MYSYNRIHKNHVDLQTSISPHVKRSTGKNPTRVASSVNRNKTFIKEDRPNNIVRSETFILKHYDSSDEQSDYNSFSKNKSPNANERKSINFTLPHKKSNYEEKALYINTDTFRKKRSSLSQESDNLNTATFTKSKSNRVESLIKRFDISFWRRHKDKSPSPSGSDSTARKSKNIFNNLMTTGKKSTRDIGIECKLDEELSREKKFSSVQLPQHHNIVSKEKRLSEKSTPERRHYSVKKQNTPVPAPIRVELFKKYTPQTGVRKKTTESLLFQVKHPSTIKIESSDLSTPKMQETSRNDFQREGENNRTSFREYRERLKVSNEKYRRADNSGDELRKSYQQSFFVPM